MDMAFWSEKSRQKLQNRWKKNWEKAGLKTDFMSLILIQVLFCHTNPEEHLIVKITSLTSPVINIIQKIIPDSLFDRANVCYLFCILMYIFWRKNFSLNLLEPYLAQSSASFHLYSFPFRHLILDRIQVNWKSAY